MEFDIMAFPQRLQDAQAHTRELERLGFSGVVFTEAGRTAYLSCTAAALATERLQILTGIAVAFPRSPMITASIAWELADATGGRFVLGLGSQVKAHIERRYGVDFAPPGPRLRDYVRAVKACFRAFRGAEKLDYQGDYYKLSLLPPTWSPGPIEVPDPPVWIAAVLPWMTRAVGEVADGLHVHPFHSLEYLRDVQRPAVQEGLARSGRELSDITFSCPVMTAVGDTDEELEATRNHARQMVAFYGSTRTYAPMFEHHGFDGLSEELHARQRSGDMAGMVGLITDDILEHYSVTAGWNDLAGKLVARYRDLAPKVRVTTYNAQSFFSDPAMREKWGHVAQAMRAAG